MTRRKSAFERTLTYSAILHISLALAIFASGCSSGFGKIDRRVEEMIALSSGELGPDAPTPAVAIDHAEETPLRPRDPYRERPPTINPAAGELHFEPRREAEEISNRLADPLPGIEGDVPPDAVHMDLAAALAYATAHSREHRFAQEEYVLAALRLLIERHLWGPRFFHQTTAVVVGEGDDGFFDTALHLIDEFRVTQRLPFGGEISARALARATADLHGRVAGAAPAAELIVSGTIPLLRGAGDFAREDRIQAERNLIYAARGYEQFRRQLHFEIAAQFLDLVVRTQVIENSERSVESFEWLERRAAAFVETGRETPIDLALAQQATLFARDRLNTQIEAFRLALERFKVRIGMPPDQPVVIVRSDPGLSVPQVKLEEAVASAFTYRLDLQTVRDQVDDARRGVAVARNLLLPDLDLFGTAGMPTRSDRRRPRLDFRPGDSFFEAGVTFSAPLDREIERINVRQSQITLERFMREYERFRDTIAVDTRSAVRNIDRALFSLRIQEENVRIAERGQEAILADPDRATARDRTEAVDRLLQARDELDAARRDLQVAILQYLLSSGQLRVAPDGTILPLSGMTVAGG